MRIFKEGLPQTFNATRVEQEHTFSSSLHGDDGAITRDHPIPVA
jgi:hypothetical protein